ncbi:MAG: hypothetical protein JW818_13980 [Pirellulales bacterium]|nr:hypothetical protein [Pirellulales bacterium]
MKRCFSRRTILPASSMICFLLFSPMMIQAGEYTHGGGQSGYWTDSSAWIPASGTPVGVPGPGDIANVRYGINLPSSPGSEISVGTLNIDTYISYGPPGDIHLYGYTLDILSGGQWMWGGFDGNENALSTVNVYGTMTLVDDIADHYNNGTEIVDAVPHAIGRGMTLNNYGTMQHDALGSFTLGSSACQYYNYGTHDFTNDGDILTVGHGGERTTNLDTILKSGGTGTSTINGELDNQGLVEVQSGTIVVGNSLQYESYATHELLGGQWIVRDNASIVIWSRGELTTNSGYIVLDGPDANFYTTQTSVYTPLEANLMNNAGTLEIHGDRIFSQAIENSGTLLIGNDTTLTVNLTNTGSLQVGNSPGHAVVDGDIAQSPAGQMLVELGGLNPGDEYDVLEVTGAATLDGTLDLSYFGTFAAAPGDAFEILSASSLDGQFSGVVYPDAQPWFVHYDTLAGTVTIGVAPEPATLGLLLGLLALPVFLRRRV